MALALKQTDMSLNREKNNKTKITVDLYTIAPDETKHLKLY